MPYSISEFDGVALPEYVERGDTQNIGVGRAATDYVQMPGGGFFDNYGDFDSPRELTAVTKQCVIYDTGGDSVRVQVDAIRAKLGVRGVLEALWHDGTTRWTWARLVAVDTTKPFNARLKHIPINVTFMPAVGVWYETETEDEEVVSGTSMAEDFSVTHAGNVNVTDPVIEWVSPVTNSLTLTIENYSTSQKITVTLLAIAINETIHINVGNRTARLYAVPVTISTIERSGNVLTVNTGSAHGLSADDEVVIRGTNYDGFYTVASAPDTDTITITADPLVKQAHGPQSPASGTLAQITDIFNSTVFTDPADWLWLVPGAQTLHVTSTRDMDGGTFRVTYNPTYA